MKTKFLMAAALSMLTAAAPAAAQTFTERLDLPFYRANGPRVLQNTSSFTTGTKLTAANEIANPSGWNNALNLALDAENRTITLTGDGGNTYQTIFIDITGVTGFRFTSFSAVTPFGAVSPTNITTSFTDSSLNISYFVSDVSTGEVFDIGTGSSVFSYTTAAIGGAVPEPATWAMMLVGFGAIGFGMRRRASSVRTAVRFA